MFKENFIKLCNIKGVSPSAACRDIGIAPATFSCWSNDSVPRRATLLRIAEYFEVSVDYLLGKEEIKKPTAYAVDNQQLYFLEHHNVYMIPLFENVSAGFGAQADNNIISYVPCYISSKTEAENTLCIKVVGDSMYPTISNGDTIQVLKQDSVDSGQIAVMLIDGEEAVVKKVFYGTDWIELHSINPMYQVRRFEKKEVLRLKVLGLVKKVIKDV